MAQCPLVLNDLARGIHENLPYVSEITVVGADSVFIDGQEVQSELAISDPDTYIRGAFWGAIIAVISFVLLVLSCVWCCVTCCICQNRDHGEKKKVVPCCLGFTVLAFILMAIGVVCAMFWAEQQVNNGFNTYAADAFSMISDGGDTFQSIFLTFELARHWVVVAFLITMLLLVVVYLLVVVLAPLCKSAVGVSVLIFLMGPAVLMLGVLSGISMTGLTFLSDLCADIYDSTSTQLNLCSGTDSDDITARITLDFFCNGVVNDVFIVMILGCALILLFVLMIAFGATYAGALINYFKRPIKTYVQPQPQPYGGGGTNVVVMNSQQAAAAMNPMQPPPPQPQPQLYPQYSASTLPYTQEEGAVKTPLTMDEPGTSPPQYGDMYPSPM